MSIPAIPPDEPARLRALRRLALLDSASDARFERLTALATRAFDVPIAQINLIDEHRQWSKSSCGLKVGDVERGVSFCAHTILEKSPLIVNDATRDSRFRDNPYVIGDPKVRFYAGQPLSHGKDDQVIGSLCLVDRRPRIFGGEDRKLLADIGELVRAEFDNRARELLIKSEERLNVLLAYSESGFYDDDFENETCYFSPRWKGILGYADDDLPNHYDTFRSVVHPEDMKRVETILKPSSAGILPFTFECRMRHKDGRWGWVESRGVVSADDELKPRRYLGFLTEVTQRRDATERLRLMELCFERIGQGMVIMDAEMAPARLSILDVNPAFEKLTGYQRSELIGQDPAILSGPFRKELRLLERLFRAQKSHVFKGDSARKDRSLLRGSWTLSPLHDEKGRPTHLITYVRALEEVEASQKEESLVDSLAATIAVRRLIE